MPTRVKVEFFGLKEFERAMGAADKFLKRELRKNLRTAGRLVIRDAKGRTHSRRVRRAFTMTARVLGINEFELEVGTNRRRAFFAHFLEKGTRASAKRPFSTRAFPFLAPAVDAQNENVFRIIGASLQVVG